MIQSFTNLNCLELISLELGLINSSKTLIGLLPVVTDRSVTKSNLLLYFMKKNLNNSDGGNDLVTIIVLANHNVNKTLILSVMKKIMDKYFEFRHDLARDPELAAAAGDHAAKAKLGEFKLYMNQIIKFEEMSYDSDSRAYSYGSINPSAGSDASRDQLPYRDVITPNQLISANEEVSEVKLLMLENINKIFGRGDKINSLVEQTERLQTSSLVFQRNAVSIKRKLWLGNAKLALSAAAFLLVLIYFFVGYECGYPLWSTCWRK